MSVPAIAGTTFDVDALLTGLPSGHSGWMWDLSFPDTTTPGALTMTGEAIANFAINLMMQSPGSCPPLPGGVPDAFSPHSAAVLDLCTAEATPPFTRGVLSRMTFQLGVAAVGMYGFSFVPGTYQIFDELYSSYPQVTVMDNSMGCGYLAIGIPCPTGPCTLPAPPAGGIAELPQLSGSSGPPYAALAGGLAAAALVLTAGAWYARRRWLR